MSNLKGISIGIDLGSTNSSVFVYDLEDKKPIPIDVGNSSPLVPSVVSYDARTRRYSYGQNAKNDVAKENIRVFKAFKMLLSEKDPVILLNRNYDTIPNEFASDAEKARANVPVNITKIFLTKIIDAVLKNQGADYVKNLVVGFPEVWNKIETAGGRFTLREICDGILNDVDQKIQKRTGEQVTHYVEVRTEPECASACAAKKIENEIGSNYSGNILLIDYGGGTLDITLSRVETNPEGCMELKVLGRAGDGEIYRQDKQIGKAGIIYMESIIEEAIREAQVYGEDEDVPHDNKFYAAVNALENDIIGGGREELEFTFETEGVDEDVLEDLGSPDEPDGWLFTIVSYPGAPNDELMIPYSLLAKCYNKIIAPTLEKHIGLMIPYFEKNGIQYMNSQTDNFKIAVVGGFGIYYPVRSQIYNMFKLNHVGDKRVVKLSEKDAELAIAHGACLLSEGILKIRKTSPLEIGMTQGNGKHIQNAILYGQEYESDKIYYCHDENGNVYKFWMDGAAIREFWINHSPRPEGAHRGILKPEIRRQLDGIRELKELPVIVGFSLDDSEILSMHVQNFNPFTKQVEGEPQKFLLSRFEEMFEIGYFV